MSAFDLEKDFVCLDDVIEDKVLSSFESKNTVNKFIDYITRPIEGALGLNGAEFQKRNYTYLMIPILDSLINFLDKHNKVNTRALSISDKVSKAKELIRADKDLDFLLKPEDEKKYQFRHAFYKVVHFLLELDSKTYPRSHRRYYFMAALENLISTDVYQEAVIKLIGRKAIADKEKPYIRQTQLILSLINTMFVGVNINALSENVLSMFLQTGIINAFKNEEKGWNFFANFQEFEWGKNTTKSTAPALTYGQEEIFFKNRGKEIRDIENKDNETEVELQVILQKTLRHLGLPDTLLKQKDAKLYLTLAHDAALCFKAINFFSETSSATFTATHKARGFTNVNFYPLMTNNFISKLWSVSYFICHNSHTSCFKFIKTNCIRFGSPTSEQLKFSLSLSKGIKKESATVLNSFLGWLDQLVIVGEKVVSFQHQNPKDKGLGKGSEKQRLDLMFEIPFLQNKRYAKTYIPIGLAMDGDWYQQTGIYAEESSPYNSFKTEYINFLKGEKNDSNLKTSPYRIDWDQLKNLGLDKENVIKDLEVQIDKMHTIYFDKKNYLSLLERQVFITFSYTFIEEYFILALKADHYHSQCKDAQDRAMTIIILTRWRNLVRSGGINDPAQRKELRTLMHFAGIFIKGTPMHGGEKNPINGRAKSFLQALHFLEMKILMNKELIQNDEDAKLLVNGEEYFFSNVKVNKTVNQTIDMLPSEAKTQEEYQIAINKDQLAERTHDLNLIDHYIHKYQMVLCQKAMDQAIVMVDGEIVKPDAQTFEKSIEQISFKLPKVKEKLKKSIQNDDYLDPCVFFTNYKNLIKTNENKNKIIEAYQIARLAAFKNAINKKGMDIDFIARLSHQEILANFLEPILKQRYANTVLGVTVDCDGSGQKSTMRIEVIGRKLYVTKGYKVEGIDDYKRYFQGIYTCDILTGKSRVVWTSPTMIWKDLSRHSCVKKAEWENDEKEGDKT